MASATSLQISDSNAKLREVQLLASLLSVSSLYTTEQTKNGCGLLGNLKQELPHSHSSTRRYRNQKEVNISDRSADTQLMEVFLIASRNDKEGGGGGGLALDGGKATKKDLPCATQSSTPPSKVLSTRAETPSEDSGGFKSWSLWPFQKGNFSF